MHYLYRYICILNVFYICIWTIVFNKEFSIISIHNVWIFIKSSKNIDIFIFNAGFATIDVLPLLKSNLEIFFNSVISYYYL